MARRSILAAGLVSVLACHGGPTDAPAPPAELPAEGAPLAGAESPAEGELSTEPADDESERAVRPPYTPPSSLGEPVEIRQARRTRMVYAKPDPDAEQRGRIPRKSSFHVYERREGPRCDKPWVKVADAGWVCLERTIEASQDPPVSLPELAEGADLPFIYARHPRHDDPATAPIPVYRSGRAFAAGDAPIDELPAYGSYAFVRERRNHGEPVLVTRSRKVVSAALLEPFEPSEFSGRDLLAHPVPAGQSLAWCTRYRCSIHERPDPESKRLRRIERHASLDLAHVGDELEGRAAGVEGADGETWFELSEGAFVADKDISMYRPEPPPEPILAGQVTLDVDLDEQVLTVWREDRPVFTTLVSTGRPGDGTPRGLFRIQTKWAYGKMASLPDADDPYYVEAVPWAMYFAGRYAFHAAYWHERFGRRHSHGCINLSPRDAKRVFELSTPRLPAGWLLVHEHAEDPGTLVRIRRAGDPVPDKRNALDGRDPG